MDASLIDHMVMIREVRCLVHTRIHLILIIQELMVDIVTRRTVLGTIIPDIVVIIAFLTLQTAKVEEVQGIMILFRVQDTVIIHIVTNPETMQVALKTVLDIAILEAAMIHPEVVMATILQEVVIIHKEHRPTSRQEMIVMAVLEVIVDTMMKTTATFLVHNQEVIVSQTTAIKTDHLENILMHLKTQQGAVSTLMTVGTVDLIQVKVIAAIIHLVHRIIQTIRCIMLVLLIPIINRVLSLDLHMTRDPPCTQSLSHPINIVALLPGILWLLYWKNTKTLRTNSTIGVQELV